MIRRMIVGGIIGFVLAMVLALACRSGEFDDMYNTVYNREMAVANVAARSAERSSYCMTGGIIIAGLAIGTGLFFGLRGRRREAR